MSSWQRQFLTYHPVIGWWFIPNLRAMIPHDGDFYLLRTNSLGMRSHREYPLRRPEGRRRIILLGDSYTAGDGVSNGERYSDRLEQLYPHLDVLNFGLPNSGTDQQLLVYETLAKPFEADAYIFAVLVENILRNQQKYRPSWEPQTDLVFYRPKPYFTLEDGHLVLHNQPVPLEKRSVQELKAQRTESRDVTVTPARRLVRRVLPLGLRRVIYRLRHGPRPRPNSPPQPYQPYVGYESEDSYGWQLMQRILERFFEQVAGKPVFVMPLPTYDFFLANAAPTYTPISEPIYVERFMTLEDRSCRRFVVDVLPYFLRLSLDDHQRCRGSNDPHYTSLAHAVVAQALSDAISKFCPELLALQRS